MWINVCRYGRAATATATTARATTTTTRNWGIESDGLIRGRLGCERIPKRKREVDRRPWRGLSVSVSGGWGGGEGGGGGVDLKRARVANNSFSRLSLLDWTESWPNTRGEHTRAQRQSEQRGDVIGIWHVFSRTGIESALDSVTSTLYLDRDQHRSFMADKPSHCGHFREHMVGNMRSTHETYSRGPLEREAGQPGGEGGGGAQARERSRHIHMDKDICRGRLVCAYAWVREIAWGGHVRTSHGDISWQGRGGGAINGSTVRIDLPLCSTGLPWFRVREGSMRDNHDTVMTVNVLG